MADRMTLPPIPPGSITRPDLESERMGYTRMPTPPRSTLVVGGPAYFTPEGYEAPRQPVQSFMPTDTRPDPIGDQFRRANPPPPAPTPEPPYIGPILPPTPPPDPRYDPVVEPTMPVAGPDPVIPPGAYPPYIPGVTPFPGIGGIPDYDFSGLPDFMGDIDFSGIPGYSGVPEPEYGRGPGPAPQYGYEDVAPPENNFFIDGDGNLNVGDGIIRTMGPEENTSAPSQGPDRGSASPNYTPPPPPPPDPPAYAIAAMADYSPTGMSNEQLKILMDSGVPIPKADYPNFEAYLASLSAPESTPEPEFVPPPQEPNGFFPGTDPEDFEDFDFDNFNLPKFAASSGLYEIPRRQAQAPQAQAPQAQAPQAQAPAPVYTPPPSQIPMQDTFEDYDYGNPNLRNRGKFGPGI